MGATGLWQFMYQTGKQYGLKSILILMNEATHCERVTAAVHDNMYKMFGDWDLVLASYNSGPGNVTKAIRRSGGQQNYWNIRKIFREKRKDMSFSGDVHLRVPQEHGIVPNRAVVKHFATDTLQSNNK
jgi:membrane-bound lytic murein transglycosylase D